MHCIICRLMADSVAKVFCPSERVTLIQVFTRRRNIDSRVRTSQFDCFKFEFHGGAAATFTTVSALGPREVSDLSPRSGPKRTLIRSQHRDFMSPRDSFSPAAGSPPRRRVPGDAAAGVIERGRTVAVGSGAAGDEAVGIVECCRAVGVDRGAADDAAGGILERLVLSIGSARGCECDGDSQGVERCGTVRYGAGGDIANLER
jgi:hypothetical protein